MNASSVLREKSFFRKLLALVVFATGAIVIILQYRWDPDPHHDGIMFTAAVGFNDGLRPNVDFFAQYGPLAPVLQGLGLRVFGETLFGLRFFSAVLITLTGAMFTYRASQFFGLKFASILWICWSLTGPMGLPWSSVMSTFLIVLVLFVSFGWRDQEAKFRPMVFLFVSQLLILGALIRIHLVVIVSLIALTLVVKRSSLPGRFTIKWFTLSISTVTVLIVLLEQLNILSAYFDQSFVWAMSHYSTPALTLNYLSGLIWFAVVPLTFLVLFLMLSRVSSLPKRYRYLVLITSLFVLASFLLYASSYTNKATESLFDPRYFMIEFFRRLSLILDYVPVSLLVLAILLQVIKGRKSFQQDHLAKLILFAVGFGTLAQLYPLFDPWHLWLISPVIILCLILLYSKTKIQQPHSSSISYIAAVVTLALGVNFITGLKSQNYDFESRVLSGMTSSRQDAPALDKTMLALEKSNVESQSVLFLCTDGLYASATQEYLSRGPYFVDWNLDASIIEPQIQFIFLCDYTQNEVNYYLESGWEDLFLLASDHRNQKSEPLYNALMKRE
jgi:hypothetical protein